MAVPELSDEDRKLLALARGARARAGSGVGAAMLDEKGRSYVGVDVALPSMRLSALELCVAQAVTGGSTGVAAAVVVTDAPEEDVDLAAVADLGGPGVTVLVADRRGEVRARVAT